MDNDTQNKINSIDALRDVLSDPDHAAAIDSNEGFKDEAEEFRDTRAILQPFLQQAAGDTKGFTLNKDRIRKALVKKAVLLTGGGYSYAKKVGDAELQSLMDSGKSDWNKTRGGEIEDNAQNVHDRLQTIVQADAAASPAPAVPISKYQVTAASLADFKTNIDALRLIEQGPRTQKGKIADAAKQVQTLVAQLTDQKDTLRRLLPQLEDSYPQLVTSLKSAMVIVDSAATHSAPKTPAGTTKAKPSETA